VSAQFDITADQGATFSAVFTWLASDQQTPVNLTGWSAAMQVRAEATNALLASFSTASGGIALGGSAGTITLSASPSTTSGWTFGAGLYDLQLTDSGGDVITLLAGLFTVTPAVTGS
jgi:hypothetical protein